MSKGSVRIVDKRQQAIRKIEEHYSEVLDKVVFQCATYTRNEAVTGIANGVKTGATYKRGNKTHTASAAGEYPATDTGELVKSISVKIDKGSADVQATAPHAMHLEFGTRNMEARPFLQPSLEATRGKVKSFLRGVIGKIKL